MKMEDKSWNRKGVRAQVTIFVIVAIVIVSVILVFFLWVQPNFLGDGPKRLGFEGCVLDAVEIAITDLGPNAGFVNPEFIYNHLGIKYPYLCYTNEYYKTCTIQVPFLKQHFEEGVEQKIRDSVNVCYSSAINDLKSRGYDVVSGDVNYEFILEPGIYRVEIEAPTVIGGARFQKFNIRSNSPLYNMLIISTSILQFESELGDSDLDSIRLFYPEFSVNKLKQGDGTTVYTMKSKLTGDEFNFASRSLAWPAGYDV
ncbi:MAG: hypothetical protein IH845_01665 [Nanoarchaeota archaeon]|nr:hypothetical protein [Nanoarchaeota archaeon]